MEHSFFVVRDIVSLESFLGSPEVIRNAHDSSSILIQVFSSQKDERIFEKITETVLKLYPSAIIVGSTTAGEIVEGVLHTSTTVLSITFFKSTVIKLITVDSTPGKEFESGKDLIHTINNLRTDVAGVLLYAVPQKINMAEVFKGMASIKFTFPVFGGGAGVYNSEDIPLIFSSNGGISYGTIAVIFMGNDTHIFTRSFSGWRPLSKEMTITDVDGMLLKKVDGQCAFDLYSKYLNIKNDKNFFNNVLEFPLLLERDGETIVRAPFFVDENGYIGFEADLQEGEKFHIGYGDPDTIIKKAQAIQEDMRSFSPDVIFLFACVCRRFLMQNEVNHETYPYNSIAPTFGFYTSGEFYSHANKVGLQNSSIVAVGIREGSVPQLPRRMDDTLIDEVLPAEDTDPYSNKHNQIVSRLLHFINAVSSELEQANQELTRIVGIDKLTQIYNRFKLDDILQSEINRCKRYNTHFSIILMDVDYFKQINDNYGHLAGDTVLVRVACILKETVRQTDVFGRWGGDEFLIILPETNLEQAALVAKKIQKAINLQSFSITKQVTCSFGVTQYIKEDNRDDILARSDRALYQAKNSSRNAVAILSAMNHELDTGRISADSIKFTHGKCP